jgi:Flp pilus assembly protein TadG
MRTRLSQLRKNDGFTLVYMAVTLTVLLLGTGIAVDSGRAYVVKAQLTKAVDGAALAAALAQQRQQGPAVRLLEVAAPAALRAGRRPDGGEFLRLERRPRLRDQ